MTYHNSVQQNIEYMETKLTDWKALPVIGVKEVEDDKGKFVSMPLFDYSLVDGFKQHKTLYPNTIGELGCCELCGHPIKYHFPIMNRYTSTTLSVGSSCISHFQELSGYEMVKKKEMQLREERAVDYLKRVDNLAVWLFQNRGLSDKTRDDYDFIIYRTKFSGDTNKKFNTLRKMETYIKRYSEKIDEMFNYYRVYLGKYNINIGI